MAQFKAEVINRFVDEHEIKRVIEFGCGDGQQLQLSNYPEYLGIDVSAKALGICMDRYSDDPGKTFAPVYPSGNRFDLALSLDVIYHLIEDDAFAEYMSKLFASSDHWVCIYSSDMTQEEAIRIEPDLATADHVRHRKYSQWISRNQPDWAHHKSVKNRFPYDRNMRDNTSLAHFDFYRKI